MHKFLKQISYSLDEQHNMMLQLSLQFINPTEQQNATMIQELSFCKVESLEIFLNNQRSNKDRIESTNDLFKFCFFSTLYPNLKNTIMPRIIEHLNQQIHLFLLSNQEKLNQLQMEEINQRQQSRINIQESVNDEINLQSNIQPLIRGINQEIEKPDNSIEILFSNQQKEIEIPDRLFEVPEINEQKVIDCFCGVEQFDESRSIKCNQCKGWTHKKCLRIQNKQALQNYICPLCSLKYMDPLRPVVKVLNEPILFAPSSNKQRIDLEFDVYQLIIIFIIKRSPEQPTQDHIIEVRCICIENSGQHCNWTRPFWPDLGQGYLNGQQVLLFEPQLNAFRHIKRHDENFKAMHVVRGSRNTFSLVQGVPNGLQIHNSQIRLTQNYIIGVFEVKILKAQEFVDLVSKSYFPQQLEHLSEEVMVSSISISANCVFSNELMEVPVRGQFCKHFQSFDLGNLVQLQYRMSPRDFRCPICRAPCFRLKVDAYQYALLQKIKKYGLSVRKLKVDSLGRVIDTNIQGLQEQENQGSEVIKKICQKLDRGTQEEPITLE